MTATRTPLPRLMWWASATSSASTLAWSLAYGSSNCAAADWNSFNGCAMRTRASPRSFSSTASRVVPGGMRNNTQCMPNCSIGHSDTCVSEYCRASSRTMTAAEALLR
jgi:hypothetical protein